MSADCLYFYEDEVFRIKKGNLEIGMVLQNSECGESDDSDEDEEEKLKKGFIRVAWHPIGNEQVLNEKKVGLVDRSLMPGDVVRRMIPGQDTQRGYCRNVQVRSSVQILGTKHVIYNVPTSDLSLIETFIPDMAVCLDFWVGLIRKVRSKLFLKFQDGSSCILMSDDAESLTEYPRQKPKDYNFRRFVFYPGQELCGPMKIFEDAEWIHCTKETKLLTKGYKTGRVLVEDIQVASACIHWLCRAYSDEDINSHTLLSSQPKNWISSEDLKRIKPIDVFAPCTVQLGDICFYNIKENDMYLTRDKWKKNEKDLLLRSKQNKCLNLHYFQQNLKTAKKGSKSKDNNLKKECRKSEGEKSEDENGGQELSDSCSASSNESSKSQDKRKKPTGLMTKMLKKKKLKRAKHAMSDAPKLRPGEKVVIEALCTVSSADVVWQDGSFEESIPSTDLCPIHHLDDQEFFPGDFVVESKDFHHPHEYGVVQCVDHHGRIAKVNWFQTYISGADPKPTFLKEEEVSVYDIKDHPDFKYRPASVVLRVANFDALHGQSTVGQVLDNYPCGEIEVSWVDGHVSRCYPQDLYKVGEFDSDEGELWEDVSSDDSWETQSEHSIAENENEESAGDESIQSKLAVNIEKARCAMSKLEEIFTVNQSLETADIVKKLMDIYKDCRYVDRLMNTNYFDESHFNGLIEQLREKSQASVGQKVVEQVSRLFSTCDKSSTPVKKDLVPPHNDEANPPQYKEQTCRKFKDSKSCDDMMICCRDDTSGNMCAELCSLIKKQLLQSYEEVVRLSGCNEILTKYLVTTESPPVQMALIVEKISSMGCVDSSEQQKSVAQVSTFPEIPGEESQSLVVSDDVKVPSEEQLASKCQGTKPHLPGKAHLTLGLDFKVLSNAPNSHKFKLTIFHPKDPKGFFKAVSKELKLLRSSLPEGIFVKTFEDRMDLFSVMIKGPSKTPYEDGLFFFDFQLSANFPKSPPLCHYISYCTDRLNPNLYEDGKVCVSLLGTWSGKGSEVWTDQSSLLQVLVSIQGLILVNEPYFNEAGYEKQKDTQQGRENSRMYNEMAVLKLVQAMTKLILRPPELFQEEIYSHFRKYSLSFICRLEKWLEISENYNGQHPLSPMTPTTFRALHSQELEDIHPPEFPLIPASKGFCITLAKSLVQFREVLVSCGIVRNENLSS